MCVVRPFDQSKVLTSASTVLLLVKYAENSIQRMVRFTVRETRYFRVQVRRHPISDSLDAVLRGLYVIHLKVVVM